MTHGQLVRRLTALVSNLKQIRDRVDAIALEQAKKPAKVAKSKARKAKPARNSGSKAIGRSIVYGGLNGKIVERSKDGAFVAKMENGRRQEISAVYVYRQLNRKAKPAKAAKKSKSAQRKKEAKVIEQLQTELDKAVTAAAEQPAQDQPAQQPAA